MTSFHTSSHLHAIIIHAYTFTPINTFVRQNTPIIQRNTHTHTNTTRNVDDNQQINTTFASNCVTIRDLQIASLYVTFTHKIKQMLSVYIWMAHKVKYSVNRLLASDGRVNVF